MSLPAATLGNNGRVPYTDWHFLSRRLAILLPRSMADMFHSETLEPRLITHFTLGPICFNTHIIENSMQAPTDAVNVATLEVLGPQQGV